MRNLKRVLSLALACVMVIGMMVMTTGAADIADIDEVKNVEAVEVMAALGVLEGDENGVFNPNGILTREQAAKIICFMLMGKDKAEKLVGTSNFTDVAADRWSAPYIAYCASLDIISGYDGKFDPTGELTGVAFGKMLLVALGYDAKVEGYVNNENWATNIGTDVIEAGIDFRGLDLAVPLTRDNAAQMAFNTLSADMVKYTNKGTTITIEGVEVVVGASSAEAVTSDTPTDYIGLYDEMGNGASKNTLQFAEKYFTQLTTTGGTDDDFGRPASHDWCINNIPFYNELQTPKVTFTAANSPAEIAKALKGYTFSVTDGGGAGVDAVKLLDATTAVDAGATSTATGELTLAASDVIANVISGLTGNGTVVEIYANRNKVVTDVVVVPYVVTKVNTVTTDVKGNVTYTLANTASGTVYSSIDYGTTDIVVYDGIKQGDIVLYTLENGVDYVYPTTSFTSKMTKYNTTEQTMVVGGETYKTAAATDASSGLTMASAFVGTNESVFYQDSYGNIVAVAGVNVADAYAVIDSIAYVTTSGVDADGYAEARLVFADGTTKVVEVASIGGFTPIDAGSSLALYSSSSASFSAAASSLTVGTTYTVYGSGNGTSYTGEKKFIAVDAMADNNAAALTGDIYTYTVANNGAYVLVDEAAYAATTGTFTKGIPTIGTAVANDNTVYVVKTEVRNAPVWTVYNGYKAMPTTNANAAYDVAKNVQLAVDFIYVDASDVGLASATTSDVAFFFGTDHTVDKTNPQNVLREYTAIVNGQLTTAIVKNAATNVANIDLGMFDITLDNGVISALGTKDAATGWTKLQANGTKAADAGVVTIDSATVNGLATQTSLTYDADTTVYYVHTVSKTINTGDITAMADNSVLYVKTVGNATAPNAADKIAIDTVYVLIAD